jgi:hypothetical protein
MRGTTSLLLPVQFLGVEVLITFYLLLLPPAILHCALSHGQRSPDAGVVSCGDHSDAHCDAEVMYQAQYTRCLPVIGVLQ